MKTKKRYKNEYVNDVYSFILNKFRILFLLLLIVTLSQSVFAEENFSIEASDIDFIEGWQVDGAAANDGWLWENDFFFEARLNPSQTVDFECWDYDQDGSYDACYADGGSTLSTCLLIPEVASICSGTSCSGSGTNEYHSIDYVALGLDNTPLKREMQIDYVPDCNNFISLIHDDEDFFLIDRRRSVCDGDNWDVQGRWGTPDKYIKYVDKSCLASQTCDPALLDTRFVSSGDIDSPCRTKDGFSCSVDSDCLTGHFCCGGFCTSDQNDCFPDVNHTLNVDVDNILEGGPLRYAKVYVDSLLVGSTDVLGKKESPIAEGIREIEVLCPDDVTFCGGETRIVDGDEYVNYDCSCAPGPKGDLLVNLTVISNIIDEGFELNGAPIAYADVYLDGQYVETTDLVGNAKIDDVNHGTYDIDINLCVEEVEGEPCITRVFGFQIVVDESFEQYDLGIFDHDIFTNLSNSTNIPSGDSRFSLTANQGYSADALPVIGAVLIVIAVVGYAEDAYNILYKCPNDFPDDEIKKWDCWGKVTWYGVTFLPQSKIVKFSKRVYTGTKFVINKIPEIGSFLNKVYLRSVEGIFKIDFSIKGKKGSYNFNPSKQGSDAIRFTNNAGITFLKNSDIAMQSVKLDANPTTKVVKIGDRVIDPQTVILEGPELGNIKGILGEEMTEEFIKQIKNNADEGVNIVIRSGVPNSVFAETSDFILRFKQSGKSIEIISKETNSVLGDIDRLVEINGKPVLFESKAARIGTIKNIKTSNFENRHIKSLEEIYGEKPDIVLNVPKNQFELTKDIGLVKRLGAKLISYEDNLEDFDFAGRILKEVNG